MLRSCLCTHKHSGKGISQQGRTSGLRPIPASGLSRIPHPPQPGSHVRHNPSPTPAAASQPSLLAVAPAPPRLPPTPQHHPVAQDLGIVRISKSFPFQRGRQLDRIPQGPWGTTTHSAELEEPLLGPGITLLLCVHFLLHGGTSTPSFTRPQGLHQTPMTCKQDNSWQLLGASPVPPPAPTLHPSLTLPPVREGRQNTSPYPHSQPRRQGTPRSSEQY